MDSKNYLGVYPQNPSSQVGSLPFEESRLAYSLLGLCYANKTAPVSHHFGSYSGGTSSYSVLKSPADHKYSRVIVANSCDCKSLPVKESVHHQSAEQDRDQYAL